MKKPSSRYRYENLVFNMRTQSNEEQKDDMWSKISNIAQLLGLAIPISILIGAITIYSYLSKLGAVSLFADIISTPASLLAIMIQPYLIISGIVLLIYTINSKFYIKSVKSLTFKNDIKSWYIISTIPSLVILIFFILNQLLYINDNVYNYVLKIIYYTLFLYPIPFVIFTIKDVIKIKNTNKTRNILQTNIENIPDIITLYSIPLFGAVVNIILLFVLGLIFVYLTNKDSNYTLGIICIAIFFIVYDSLIYIFEWQKRIIIRFAPIAIITIILTTISPNQFLEKLGYIEKNTDARWYLLDTRFINQYGLVKKEGTTGLNDKDTLKEWQIKFCKEPKMDSCIRTENYAFFQYKNAVYGYMAWNLGKTKIFCPHYVTIESTQRDKTTIDKVCLTINGDYLQPIPDDL